MKRIVSNSLAIVIFYSFILCGSTFALDYEDLRVRPTGNLTVTIPAKVKTNAWFPVSIESTDHSKVSMITAFFVNQSGKYNQHYPASHTAVDLGISFRDATLDYYYGSTWEYHRWKVESVPDVGVDFKVNIAKAGQAELMVQWDNNGNRYQETFLVNAVDSLDYEDLRSRPTGNLTVTIPAKVKTNAWFPVSIESTDHSKVSMITAFFVNQSGKYNQHYSASHTAVDLGISFRDATLDYYYGSTWEYHRWKVESVPDVGIDFKVNIAKAGRAELMVQWDNGGNRYQETFLIEAISSSEGSPECPTFPEDQYNEGYQAGVESCQTNNSEDSCAVLENNFDITLPCIDVFGTQLPIGLERFTNPDDPFGYYWNLNIE